MNFSSDSFEFRQFQFFVRTRYRIHQRSNLTKSIHLHENNLKCFIWGLHWISNMISSKNPYWMEDTVYHPPKTITTSNLLVQLLLVTYHNRMTSSNGDVISLKLCSLPCQYDKLMWSWPHLVRFFENSILCPDSGLLSTKFVLQTRSSQLICSFSKTVWKTADTSIRTGKPNKMWVSILPKACSATNWLFKKLIARCVVTWMRFGI